MSRKTWVAAAALLLIAALVAFYLTTKKAQDSLNIGAILPLTGDGSQYGQEAQRGIELAISEANATNGVLGKPVAIIYEDDQGLARNAVTAFNKLASVDKVPVVIGPMFSSTALAVAPIANEEQIVLFSPSASSPDYTTAGEYAFRNWPSDVYEGGEMAKFAYNILGARHVAILSVNLDYGIGLSNIFKTSFESLGGRVVLNEKYPQGATDFRTQIARLKAAAPDAVYLPGYYTEIGLILKQSREVGLQLTVLSCVGFDNPESLRIAGTAAEGVYFARPAYDAANPSPLVSDFVKLFKARYGTDPGTYAAHAYDATRIILAALGTGASSGPDLKEALYKIKNFPGVTGTTNFDSNGDVVKPIQLMTVRHDLFIKVDEATDSAPSR